MKSLAILRFELRYQLRRPWPWLAFAVLVLFTFENARTGILPVTISQDFVLNSPFIIASVSVFSCLIWLLVASAIAGEAAARDLETGMDPLTYSSPIKKWEYLGGRLLAAFLLNALVLLGVQVGLLLAFYAGGVDPTIIGPFRPAAHLAAFAFVALPNAFTATAIQFAAALFSGRSLASYAGSVIIFFFTVPLPLILYVGFGQQEVALLVDPIGLFAIMNEMMNEWTFVEKNVRMFTLEGSTLWNRLLWFGIAAATVGVTHLRFRLAHRAGGGLLSRFRQRVRRPRRTTTVNVEGPAPKPAAISVPAAPLSFGPRIHVRQSLSVARSSFRMIARSVPGLFLLVVYPAFALLDLATSMEHWGVPILPHTGYILSKQLTAPLTFFSDYRVLVPLMIVYFAGELIWREREASISENIDATSVPDWAVLLGKFMGVGMVLTALMVSVTAAGLIGQMLMDFYDFELGLYLKILFGLQLPEYLLFAALALVVQAVVNQKHVAMLATLTIYLSIVFSATLGIEHNLLIFGGGPTWYFTDMRGFGPTIEPWLWFKLYWTAWALLLAVASLLFWVRGRDTGLEVRLRIARRRLSRGIVGCLAASAAVVLVLGGFIFYNTNVLNEYVPGEEQVQLQAEYERRYGHFEGKPQPERAATNLQIEVYPHQRAVSVRGSYLLVNRSDVAIDSLHVEPAFDVETTVDFDQVYEHVIADDELGHHVYALANPLQPGDSLTLSFTVDVDRRGFSNSGGTSTGASQDIVENGSYFTAGLLPAVGYRPQRELMSPDDRHDQGLPRQVTLPPPGDIDPAVVSGGAGRFEAVIGTAADQVAVAPGELRGEWTDGGRRYFRYVSDVPLRGEEFFFSADYDVHREEWNGVEIRLFVHPWHVRHAHRMLRSARASLEYYSEQFGPYPHRFLQIVEQPGNFVGMGVDGSGVVTGGEGVFLVDPQHDGFDVISEVVAHEMGHQWWGVRVTPAIAEGGGVISESLAWYSAMQLIEHMKGREALRRFMSTMREPNPIPPMHTGLPLLRAMDPWAIYRKGPFAMHALSEYVGEDRVNAALRNLVTRNKSSLVTTLGMYHELQAVTPDSLVPLLHDLFEVNAYWRFDTKSAKAKETDAGRWEVTFEVSARKVVVDSAGVETEVPIRVPVEIGVFAAAGPGRVLGEPLYVQKHPIRSGTQTITLTVPQKPARGGIDPYNLLDWEQGDNIEGIEIVEGDVQAFQDQSPQHQSIKKSDVVQ